MIKIKDKRKCTGCAACVQVCPRNCIEFLEDDEGFSYPIVDETACINCNLCEAVCPVINQGKKSSPLLICASKNKDKAIREQSSSGGVFSLFAQQVIAKNGVVFGAKFDENWEVVHGYSETEEGLAAFRKSKYVQSYIGNTFKEVKQFLKAGREVLYSGTPCQIAGLKLYLRKDYDKLLTLDHICHGVPSRKIWRMYLSSVLGDKRHSTIENISFREKTYGWSRFSMCINMKEQSKSLVHELLDENIYLRGFLRDLYLRPSCHACPAKKLKSGSDITLADFWGVESLLPHFYDKRGVSLVTINTEKGQLSYSRLDAESEILDNGSLQRMLVASVKEPRNRRKFFQAFHKNPHQLLSLIDLYSQDTLSIKIKKIIKPFILKWISLRTLNKLRAKIK